jgi:hypothetical protein
MQPADTYFPDSVQTNQKYLLPRKSTAPHPLPLWKGCNEVVRVGSFGSSNHVVAG